MRLRNWWLAALMLLSIVAACSGNSESKDPGEPTAGADDGAGRPSTGGSAGRGGGAGRGGSAGAARGGSAGSGGSGNVGAEAGEAGMVNTGGTLPVAGTGGVGGVAGSAAVAGTAGIAGSGGTVNIPLAWRCSASLYGNGSCDCGCGDKDPDCESTTDLDECESCNQFGSCSSFACPGRIDPDSTDTCRTAPSGWTCLSYYYADSVYCDCGCGVMDPDCDDDDIDSCDTCGLAGGCGGGSCPGPIDPEDITQCATPEGWTCATQYYANGTCDCGCGAHDPDCQSANSYDCYNCTAPGSCAEYDGYCSEHITEDDNATCSGPPPAWTCNRRFYEDGTLCHCGCGVIDPDCADKECEVCNLAGSCSRRACPGSIDPNNEAFCRRPEVPSGWTCDYGSYGDGYQCDCGCGVQDFDCLTNDLNECQGCWKCSGLGCPAGVDPADPTQCSPPPDGWRCEPQNYQDGAYCDCGCGLRDPDCEGTTTASCSQCPDSGCAHGDCGKLDPADNAHCLNEAPPDWTCDLDYYGDQACDCGCGVIDVDCAGPARGNCIFCNGEGSCSSAACPGSINADNNAICGG